MERFTFLYLRRFPLVCPGFFFDKFLLTTSRFSLKDEDLLLNREFARGAGYFDWGWIDGAFPQSSLSGRTG